ncbi:MAG: hypothetical protein LBK60_01030, partial [Verrucomicrobiales bacterium]|nr:hypothetical protein [Verrucomicrobiales bacterium]
MNVRAQFVIDPSVGAKDYREYSTDTNWINNTVNNLFFGPVNAVTVSVPDATFAAGSNVIFTGAVNATQFKVGDMIGGTGIPDGTIITAINNTGVITISAATTAASSGALTVTGIGEYQRPSKPQSPSATYITVADSNEIVVNIDAEHFFAVGETLYSAGVPNGTTITAISGSTLTVSVAAATSGTFTGGYATPGDPGNYGAWLVKTTGAYTVSGDQFVYKNSDYGYFTLGQSSNNWTLAPASGTFAFIVDMGAPGEKMQFNLGSSGWNGTLNAKDSAVVFNIDPTGNSLMTSSASGLDTVTLAVSATNVGLLTKDGVGSLLVNTNVLRENIYMRVGGTVNINNGQIVVSTSGTNWTAPRISGAKEYNLNAYGAVLQLNASGNGSGNLIESDAKINLHSGVFNAYGTTVAASQQVGDVTLKGGRSVIGTAGANQNFTLTMNKLLRENNATVNFLFGNIATPIVIGDTANAVALAKQLVGGAGAADSPNISILPWASAQTSSAIIDGYQTYFWNSSYFAGSSFVTISGGTLRMLTDTEYYSTTTSGAITQADPTDNIWIRNNAANNTVSVSTTVNSLRFNTDWDVNIAFQNSSTLTVTSGAIMLASNQARFHIGNGGGGTLNTGTNPLIVQSGATGYDNTIHVPYINTVSDQNSPGLILALNPTARLLLDAANNYNGYTLVQSGSLVVQKTNALNTNAALLLDQTGAVTISNSALIAVTELRGDGKVDFSGGTDASPNQLNINASIRSGEGVNNTIAVGAGGVIAPGGVATPDGVG